MRNLLGHCLLSAICAAMAPAAVAQQGTVFPGVEWATSTPAAQGVDPSLLEDAVSYLQANSPQDGVSELVIIRNGYLIWAGSDIDHRHGVWSCTKSFTSTVLGLLTDDRLTTLDTRVATRVSSMKAAYPSATFRHFATMTSGYFAVGDDFSAHGQSGTPFAPKNLPLFAPPGSKFAYWDSAMNQFANGLTRVAEEPIENLFGRRIGDPIGMRTGDWDWGDWGSQKGFVTNGGAGNIGMMEITARQLARLGHLFLNRGNWNGQQLISASWVDAATSNQVSSTLPFGHAQASAFEGQGVYGFNWWVNGIRSNGARKWPGVPDSTYSAWGANNNVMFVIPAWNIVVVRLGLDEFGLDEESGFLITDDTYATFLQKIGQALPEPQAGPGLAAGVAARGSEKKAVTPRPR